MRNKGRFEYVDEMRKIGTIEKMGPIESLYPVDFQQQKVENNKFIRYKQQVVLEQPPKKLNYLFANEIITAYKQDIEPQCSAKFTHNLDNITTDTTYFKNWSDNLNVQIKKRDYEHRFYFQDAQPPPRLKEEGKEKSKKEEGASGQEKLKGKDQGQEEDTNLDLPQREKYKFAEITKKLYMNRLDKDDEGSHLANAGTKNQILELRKLKTLEEIQRLGGFQDEFGKFSYYIELPEPNFAIDFVESSIVRGSNNLTLDYFRDIGMPSRDIAGYTVKNYNKMKAKEEEEEIPEEGVYGHQKRELLYLYFLKQHELKINKNDINFSDVANFSMGRITSANAHMCVRNEKVTKAQYMKLLKKMEKYDMRENEGSKAKNHKEVGTEDLEDIALPPKDQAEQDEDEQNLGIENTIEEINRIKKEVALFEKAPINCTINKEAFYYEVYAKMESMLNILYAEVTQDLPIKYPLSEIRAHIPQIQGRNELGFQRMRLLWYIASSYDEMSSRLPKRLDLRNIIGNKQKATPVVSKYKGQLLVNQDTNTVKKVYGFNHRPEGKSPIGKANKNTTPVKNGSTTPVKQKFTEKKKDDLSTSSKKWPATAKK